MQVHEASKNDEELYMTMESESANRVLRLWLLLHRVHDVVNLCEESILREYGLTPEQFAVLASVRSDGGSLRPVDLALMLERSPNSVSMLIDRMVKAGLVRRTRDRKDRRAVNVTLTGKGAKALEPAAPADWEFVQSILLTLRDEDKHALANMLETVKCEAFAYLHPELDKAEIMKNSFTNQTGLYERIMKDVLPSGAETKRQGVKKRR
jgi:DNA-binding MarR family transcriptional regulator